MEPKDAIFPFQIRMEYGNLNRDKGVAGLTILLSLVTMLFVIGLLVRIFSLMGGELIEASYTSTTGSADREELLLVNNVTAVSFANAGLTNVVCTVSNYTNTTGGLIDACNYTTTGFSVLATSGSEYNGTTWNATYDYVYDADNTATGVMNDTTNGISGVTSWFNIFIVIAAMVVLILLTVIIITAIRGSGLIGGTSKGSQGGSGSA